MTSGARATPVDDCRSWAPAIVGVTEVFHAAFTEHAYPLHCHDTWTVLIVDDGAVSYKLASRARGADRRRVTVLPPGVAHDGRSARPGQTFRKRVLYVDDTAIGTDLVGPAVDRSDLDDRALRAAVARLHQALGPDRDDLEASSLLAIVSERIATRLRGQPAPTPPHSTEAAEALRASLDAAPYLSRDLAVEGARLGWSPTHLIRSFSRTFGLPPHRYLISRRVDAARRHLLDGMPPSQVAATVGFCDQSHLHRHFTPLVGTTPGRFQRSASASGER